MSLPQDPEHRKAIRKALDELSASMTRIEGERDYITETIKKLSEEYQLNKKVLRRMAKTYHRQNFSSEIAENEEFETMYEQVTGETTLGKVDV